MCWSRGPLLMLSFKETNFVGFSVSRPLKKSNTFSEWAIHHMVRTTFDWPPHQKWAQNSCMNASPIIAINRKPLLMFAWYQTVGHNPVHFRQTCWPLPAIKWYSHHWKLMMMLLMSININSWKAPNLYIEYSKINWLANCWGLWLSPFRNILSREIKPINIYI